MKRHIDHDTTTDVHAVDSTCAALIASVASDDAAHAAAAAAIAANDALNELDQEALSRAIIDMFSHADARVRHAAVAALFKLDKYGTWLLPMTEVESGNIKASVLASHAGLIVSMLTHKDANHAHRRCRALDLIRYAAPAMHKPAVLELVFTAVKNTMLTDGHRGLRCEASERLTSLKPLYNWTKVRAHVQDVYLVRPYAFFWYEHACEKMCAPGGQWANRDRAAFETEFND